MSKFRINSITNIENNPFDRQERIDWWSQEKLKDAKIMVVGAGAIGNETLKNLALLGVGNIFIVDFDVISMSNLSRTVLFGQEDVGKKKAEIAAKRTKELALLDDIKIDWFHGDLVWELGTGIYDEVDIVLGCLDNVETRIAVNKHCWLTETPWIDAGMNELALRVEFYKPPELPCYQCNLTNEQIGNANKRYSCDFFKKKSFKEGKIPTTQIASAIVSALQVQECVKYICGKSVSLGKKIYFQGTINDFNIFTKKINNNCYAHVNYDNVISIPLTTNVSLKEFLTFISQEKYSGKGATLDFRGDRTFIKVISCRSCGRKITIMRPTFRVEDIETVCTKCQKGSNDFILTDIETQKEIQEQFNFENTSGEILDMSLHKLGVPYMHIVAVLDLNGNYKYYKFDADKYFLLPEICSTRY
jgi:adenylyltransferase/sulfurtransferase